jgi:predicted extracellular nuclease
MSKLVKQLFLLTFLLAFQISASAQHERRIAFYNVENLFDTIDGENDDSEFLPGAKSQWNYERYRTKLEHINQVLDNMDSPALVGMCEVENEQVIKDLITFSSQRNDYQVIHYESPDARGIDVAFMYDPSIFKVLSSGNLRFHLPGKDQPSTRDIVWAKLLSGRDTLHCLVNHWPSRRGGTEESEPNRIKAAETARKYIDSVQQRVPRAKIILMGDLNDHPTDKAPLIIDEKLDPMITAASGEYGGTHNYKDEWGILDHIFVSPSLSKKKGLKVLKDSGKIHSFDFNMTEYKGKMVPNRTYAGDKYLGGYSDHLPVSIMVSFP